MRYWFWQLLLFEGVDRKQLSLSFPIGQLSSLGTGHRQPRWNRYKRCRTEPTFEGQLAQGGKLDRVQHREDRWNTTRSLLQGGIHDSRNNNHAMHGNQRGMDRGCLTGHRRIRFDAL